MVILSSARQHVQKICSSKWCLERIRRTAKGWAITISIPDVWDETIVINAGPRQLSWPIFQVVAFVQAGVWLYGPNRESWRAAVVRCLYAGRQGAGR